MDPQSLSNPNPNSLKTRFAQRFIRALMRIQNQQPKSSSPGEISKRHRKVNTAANAAMASAVGPRRVWSQALLWRIRNRSNRNQARHRRRRALFKRIGTNSMKRKGLKERRGTEEGQLVGFGKEKKLRKLVPGGAAMDICSLLDETAHYIRCLTTQVKVMKRIAEIYST
ncbi:IBH1 transcription factor [Parasponia andersonii]|uniref:IBH1 transcription factor n=1 Tax=Parasponia andersonii TaxID=3476 RepID=A0A2P5DPB1_PARAD|nr:IBH1 transcription factor [Parasponia andersonii]